MTYGFGRRVLFVSALLVGALVTGCGGGGSGPAAVPGLSNHGATTQGQVSIKIPPKTTTTGTSRKPAYVSPDTESIGIIVTPNGQPAFPVVMVDVPGTDCTGGGEEGYSCTVTVQAQQGDNSLTITTYSLPDGGGSVLSSGTVDQSFAPGQSPAPINVTLSGVVSSVVMTITHNDIDGNTEIDQNVPVGQEATLNLTAEDASGNAIIGTYATPITVTSTSNKLSLLTSFPDSAHSTTKIDWQDAPYYYGAPTDEVDFKAYQGETLVGSIQLNPTSTVLTFPAGDGTTTDDAIGTGLVSVANKLYYTTLGYAVAQEGGGPPDLDFPEAPQNGNLGEVDIAAGSQSITPALGYVPSGIYVDPTYQGIWVGNEYDSTYETGSLECYTGIPDAPSGEFPVPVPEPTAGAESDPVAMVADSQSNLWFADSYNDDIGFAPMTGQCALTDTAFKTFTSPAGDSYFSQLAFDGTNVWANDESNSDAWWMNAQSGGVTSAYLPGAQWIGAIDNDAQGNIDAAGIAENEGSVSTILGEVPSGNTQFGNDPQDLPNLNTSAMAADGTGASKVIAFAADVDGGIGYFPTNNQPLAGYLAAPNAAQDYGCTQVAFDAEHMPWSICTDGTTAHLERFILTGAAWNLFLDTSDVGEKNQYATIAGIGGGSAATTFTLLCTGVQCNQTTPGGRSFTVYANEPGSASVQVTGSDGRVVTQNFTVTILEDDDSIGRRLTLSARGRRLLGPRTTARLMRR